MSSSKNPSNFHLYNYLHKEHYKNLRRRYNVNILSDKISSLPSVQQEYIFLIVVAHFNIYKSNLVENSNDVLDYKKIYEPSYNDGIITYEIKNLPVELLSMLDIYVDKLFDKKKRFEENDEIKLIVATPSKSVERNKLKLKSFSNFTPNTIKKPTLNCDVKYQTNMLGDKYKILVLTSNDVEKKTTNLKCWWCKETFNGISVGVPIDYIKLSDGKHTFPCDQNCCSWECVLAILDENDKYLPQYRNKHYEQSRIYLKWIFKQLEIGDIEKTNHWSELDCFSKDGLSINEFRKNNYKIKFSGNIILRPTSRIYSLE